MKYFTATLILVLLIFLGIILFKKPSNTLSWEDDQTILPTIKLTNNAVTFENIRDFSYTSEFEYTKAYKDKTFPVTNLQSVDYIVVPFGSIGGAHTFLSFGFLNEAGEIEYVAISVEIRKEKQETFSALKGLMREYEIMYVVASEEDAIQLRTNHRNNDVYLYPTNGAQSTQIALLKDIAKRINTLYETPEFYNTVTNNCTTNIAQHINNINDKEFQVPWNISLLLPEKSDVYANERNFLNIDKTLSTENMREKYFISDKAKEASDTPFSEKIRS
jgi:hypothetical protein